MLEIYKSATQDSSTNCNRYSEICRDCAKEEVEKGYHVEYDLYHSERSGSITREDTCQICEGDFFVDGRKKFTRLEGVIY